MWIVKCKKIGINLIEYMFGVIISFLMYNFFVSLGMLEFLNVDIIPFISIQQISVFLGLCICFMLIWSLKKKSISVVNIVLKKYIYEIHFMLYIFSILIWYKCKIIPQLLWIYAFEMLIFYMILENEAIKVFDYKYLCDSSTMSNYKEKSIVGRNNLTKSQKKALDQLINILDKRRISESFNIALIGAWGSGKTSITDTLISELQNRKKSEKRYFILKINTLTFNGTKNIIEYVKKYFYCLFKQYGIVGLNGKENVAFLSALADMLNDTDTKSSVINMLFSRKETCFCDIENERQLFMQRVQKLLYISGRKNIVFVIDDSDRSDIEEQVLKLLSEFSSIDGLISLILLDKKHDINLRKSIDLLSIDPGETDDITNDVYMSIDKYVHIRVRIEDDFHVEYEERIKHQIILENKAVTKKENCYINCDGERNTISLFSFVKDYPTAEFVKQSMNFLGNYNILTELFLCNLEKQDKGFGDYFEGIVLEYLYHSKELLPFIRKMLLTKPEEWDFELHRINMVWTNSFGDDRFDWLIRLQNNSNQMFWMLYQLIEASEMVGAIESKIQNEILNFVDLYDYYMITKMPVEDRTWENRKENPVKYSGLDDLEVIVFEKEEIKTINIYIQEKQYEKVKLILVEKIKDVSNFYLISAILNEFMAYLRNIMNNFRTFKMQLREAELLDMNYLDYLIKEWQPTKSLTDNIEKMKKETSALKNLNISYPSLNAYINMVLYTNYISKFDTRFFNGELKNSRLWIMHGERRNIIVISSKQNTQYEFHFLDSQGNIIEDLCEDEIREIQRKNIVVWSN